MMKPRSLFLLILALVCPLTGLAQRQTEKLGRGVVVLRTSSTQTYISWRLLGDDPDTLGFNLYRKIGSGSATKVNSAVLTTTTDFTDTPGSTALNSSVAYFVRPVLNGVEQNASASYALPANAPVRQYLSIPLQTIPQYPGDATDTFPYDVKFSWVGDLDGNGEYDFVVDRISTDPNNTHREYVEAYKLDGTFLWRVNMGPNSVNQYNISPGSSAISVGHCDHVTVYDMDGDGKAEVLLKTSNGTILGDGSVVTAANDTIEYISVLDGLTGAEKARATVPNPFSSIGPLSGHFGIMYCDGTRPSLLFEGENRNADLSFNMVATTWDYRNGQISQRWTFQRDSAHPTRVAHQIRIADVNNDGKDEYCDISFVLAANGTQLFSNELIHGDRFHIADIDPDHPGLETFAIQQNNPTMLATAYYESATGKIIKKWYSDGIVDVGRGIALDIDPNHKGYEFYSTQPGIFDSKGTQIYANNIWPPEGLWWDGDLSREFIDGAGSGALNPVVNKFSTTNGAANRLYTIYNDNGGVHQAYGGRPAFTGDILGDWREELVLVANDYSELRIYVTKIAATTRLYTLMQNPAYRLQATCKGYVQSSYVDYYLGTGMTPPPPPPMVNAQLRWRGGTTGSDWEVGIAADWVNNDNAGAANTYADGNTVLFDLTGNNGSTINLVGSLQPGAVTVYSPSDYIFGGSGSLTGNMALTKVGAGTLTLTANHSFTGNTVVWDGALLVNGDLQQSPVTVWGGTWGGALAAGRTGGRIGGNGRFSHAVSVLYRGAVTPGGGMNSTGNLTFGAGLTMGDGSTLALDLSDDPTGLTKANDHIAITGNFTLSGNVSLVINALNTQLAPGNYSLVTYTGSLLGNLSNITVTAPDGTPYTLLANGGALILSVASPRAPGIVTWAGGVSSNKWDIATTQNWRRNGTADVFVSGDTVQFDNTGATNANVTLAAALPVASVVVNSSANYSFSSNGAIAGTGGLTKSGSGMLTLNATNTYTGPTVVTGGTLAVNNLNDGGVASSVGASSGNASNLIINGGTLMLTGPQTNTNRNFMLGANGAGVDISPAGNSLQVSGVINGTGALVKNGAGVLILAGNNTYSGGTTLANGTILLASAGANSNGLGTGSVTIVNGTLSMSDVQASETAAWSIIVPANATARLEADGRCSLTGSLSGSGNFTFYTGYVRTDLKGNWSSFSGNINVVTDSDGGDFRVTNTNGYANAAISLGDQVFAYYNSTPPSSGLTLDIGELSGVATASLKGGPTAGRTLTWRIGAKNTSSTYAGNITDSTGPTAITKTGAGTLTLAGTLSYTGNTTVTGGTLQISGAGTGNNTIEVQSGGTLDLPGNVSIGTLYIRAGGTLTGNGVITGNVVNQGTVTLATGTGTPLRIVGNLTNSGTLRLANGTGLTISGALNNTGLIDATTGANPVAGTLSNNGTYVNASSIKLAQVRMSGTSMVMSIQSYAGHNYQLQRTTTLKPANWTNVGSAQAGTGGTLQFSDPAPAINQPAFYHILVSP